MIERSTFYRWRPWLLVLATFAVAGCSRSDYLNERYGRRNTVGSVNGTSVFSEMCEAAGHRVRSWRYLSPLLEDADVIVWFPGADWDDDIGAPSYETIDWLDTWLRYGEGPRTLIYVGRQWEAAPEYWAQVQSAAPAGQTGEYTQRKQIADSEQQQRINSRPDPPECDWFTLEPSHRVVSVNALSGPLAEDVDAGKAGLEHWTNLQIHRDAESLLADGDGHPLISEVTFGSDEWGWGNEDARLLLVENGAFLLNGGLVNHERRKIAGRLISHLGSPELRVVFLEGGADPPIHETDPNPRPPSGLELFTIWPIGAVLAQLAALGIVYALTRWPIFGVPRRLEQPSLTDFGRHVQALARLLAATRDRSYAVTQLNTYFHSGPPTKQAVRHIESTPAANSPQPQDSSATSLASAPVAPSAPNSSNRNA